jgi:proton-dependent oligopeptide transporter, POT family
VATANPQLGRGEASLDHAFFGHPRGLSTLFFTEMWERFSFYGMRALLILFMTAAPAAGGLGFSDAAAGAVYGMYMSMVYMMSLPGGWIADRLLGQRRSVFYGGIIIASGHFCMAVPTLETFYLGLVLIVLGTGLLKPNVSVIVGQLYGENDIRRDAGFSIFYMGINLGAFIAPLVTGFLAQDPRFQTLLSSHGIDPHTSWHFGFGAAGVGMTLGVIQYVLGSRKRLGTAGLHPSPPKDAGEAHRTRQAATFGLGGGLFLLVLVGVALATGLLPLTIEQIADILGYVLLGVVVGFFAWLFFFSTWTTVERNRLFVIAVFFLASALFWSVFEQAGSTLNLFADRSTRLEAFGWHLQSSYLQSLNSLFIIIFAPIFGWLWVKLAGKHKEPSSPVKFSLGLIGVGLGFAILVPASQMASTGVRVSVLWLTSTYLIHTFAELSLSPIGLSAMTKLAPTRIVSLMMGVWFVGTAVGEYIGGRIAGLYSTFSLPHLFGAVGAYGILAGVIMWLFAGKLKKLMHGIT